MTKRPDIETDDVPSEVRWTKEYVSPGMRQYVRRQKRAYIISVVLIIALPVLDWYFDHPIIGFVRYIGLN